MGWASGSELMASIIKIAERYVDGPSKRIKMYEELIQVFEDHDCDTLEECEHLSRDFKIALRHR